MDQTFIDQDTIGWCHECGLVQRYSSARFDVPEWYQGLDEEITLPIEVCANPECNEPWEFGIWFIWPASTCIQHKDGDLGNYAPVAPCYVGHVTNSPYLSTWNDLLPPRPVDVKVTDAQRRALNWIEGGCIVSRKPPATTTLKALVGKGIIVKLEGNYLPCYAFTVEVS